MKFSGNQIGEPANVNHLRLISCRVDMERLFPEVAHGHCLESTGNRIADELTNLCSHIVCSPFSAIEAVSSKNF